MKTFLEWLVLSPGRDEANGWLSPRGRFYTCRSAFGHSKLALDTPEIRVHISEETISRANEEGDVEIIYWDVWRAGFIRVSEGSNEMFFEGKSDAIRNLYHRAREIAEEMDLKAHFLPVDRQASGLPQILHGSEADEKYARKKAR